MARILAHLASRMRACPEFLLSPSGKGGPLHGFALSKPCSSPSGISTVCSSIGEVFSRQHLSSSGRAFPSKTQITGVPDWKVGLSTRLHGLGGSNVPQFMAGGVSGGSLQVRTIMVEVKGNDLDRAIRKWRRKCKEENLKSLKDREYYRKPSEKRVLALKERDHRIARRAFKIKLNWIMSRRQRGF